MVMTEAALSSFSTSRSWSGKSATEGRGRTTVAVFSRSVCDDEAVDGA